MKAEDHLSSFKEHKETIFDWALKIKGLKKSQRIVGLHASRAIIDLLAAYLHLQDKISIGAQINHRWFKSMSIAERLPEFPFKKEILPKMIKLETDCEALSYGAPKPVEQIKKVLLEFTELEEEIKKRGNIDE